MPFQSDKHRAFMYANAGKNGMPTENELSHWALGGFVPQYKYGNGDDDDNRTRRRKAQMFADEDKEDNVRVSQVDAEGNLFKNLSPVTISAKSPYGPYHSRLSQEQKDWLLNNKGKNDAITRGVKAQAKSGYGLDGNPTYGESVSDFATGALTAPFKMLGQVLQTPQSLAVETYEGFQGNPYSIMDALPGDPNSTTQRRPSQIMSSLEGAHWTEKLAADIALDPLNLIGIGLIDDALKLGGRAALTKPITKAKNIYKSRNFAKELNKADLSTTAAKKYVDNIYDNIPTKEITGGVKATKTTGKPIADFTEEGVKKQGRLDLAAKNKIWNDASKKAMKGDGTNPDNITLTRVQDAAGLHVKDGKLFKSNESRTWRTKFDKKGKLIPEGAGTDKVVEVEKFINQRNTTHFASGHVADVAGSGFKGRSTAIITNADDIGKVNKLAHLHPTDTWFHNRGDFQFPENTIVLTKDKKLFNQIKNKTNIHAKYIGKDVDAKTFEDIVNAKVGHNNMFDEVILPEVPKGDSNFYKSFFDEKVLGKRLRKENKFNALAEKFARYNNRLKGKNTPFTEQPVTHSLESSRDVEKVHDIYGSHPTSAHSNTISSDLESITGMHKEFVQGIGNRVTGKGGYGKVDPYDVEQWRLLPLELKVSEINKLKKASKHDIALPNRQQFESTINQLIQDTQKAHGMTWKQIQTAVGKSSMKQMGGILPKTVYGNKDLSLQANTYNMKKLPQKAFGDRLNQPMQGGMDTSLPGQQAGSEQSFQQQQMLYNPDPSMTMQNFAQGGLINDNVLAAQYPKEYEMFKQEMSFAYGGRIPQYGFGEWLGRNASTVGAVAGGIGGFFVAGPAGAMAGAKLGQMIGQKFQTDPETGEQVPVEETAVAEEEPEVVREEAATASLMAYGGDIDKAEFEIEGGETIQAKGMQVYGSGGGLNYLAEDAAIVQGNDHGPDSRNPNSGVKMAASDTEEGRIFSKRIKNPKTGKTFAKESAELLKKIGKYEDVIANKSKSEPIAIKTAQIMSDKYNTELDILFTKQEELKKEKGISSEPRAKDEALTIAVSQEQGMLPQPGQETMEQSFGASPESMMAYGGRVPQYEGGVDLGGGGGTGSINSAGTNPIGSINWGGPTDAGYSRPSGTLEKAPAYGSSDLEYLMSEGMTVEDINRLGIDDPSKGAMPPSGESAQGVTIGEIKEGIEEGIEKETATADKPKRPIIQFGRYSRDPIAMQRGLIKEEEPKLTKKEQREKKKAERKADRAERKEQRQADRAERKAGREGNWDFSIDWPSINLPKFNLFGGGAQVPMFAYGTDDISGETSMKAAKAQAVNDPFLDNYLKTKELSDTGNIDYSPSPGDQKIIDAGDAKYAKMLEHQQKVITYDAFKSGIHSIESGAEKDPYKAIPYKRYKYGEMKKDGKKAKGGEFLRDDEGNKIKASSAAGKYQFLWSQNKNAIKEVTGVETKQEFLNDKKAQEDYMDHWMDTTLIPQAKKIREIYTDSVTNYSDGDIQAMIHFLGYSGTKKYVETGEENTTRDNVKVSKYLKIFRNGVMREEYNNSRSNELKQKIMKKQPTMAFGGYLPDFKNRTYVDVQGNTNTVRGKKSQLHMNKVGKGFEGYAMGGIIPQFAQGTGYKSSLIDFYSNQKQDDARLKEEEKEGGGGVDAEQGMQMASMFGGGGGGGGGMMMFPYGGYSTGWDGGYESSLMNFYANNKGDARLQIEEEEEEEVEEPYTAEEAEKYIDSINPDLYEMDPNQMSPGVMKDVAPTGGWEAPTGGSGGFNWGGAMGGIIPQHRFGGDKDGNISDVQMNIDNLFSSGAGDADSFADYFINNPNIKAEDVNQYASENFGIDWGLKDNDLKYASTFDLDPRNPKFVGMLKSNNPKAYPDYNTSVRDREGTPSYIKSVKPATRISKKQMPKHVPKAALRDRTELPLQQWGKGGGNSDPGSAYKTWNKGRDAFASVNPYAKVFHGISKTAQGMGVPEQFTDPVGAMLKKKAAGGKIYPSDVYGRGGRFAPSTTERLESGSAEADPMGFMQMMKMGGSLPQYGQGETVGAFSSVPTTIYDFMQGQKDPYEWENINNELYDESLTGLRKQGDQIGGMTNRWNKDYEYSRNMMKNLKKYDPSGALYAAKAGVGANLDVARGGAGSRGEQMNLAMNAGNIGFTNAASVYDKKNQFDSDIDLKKASGIADLGARDANIMGTQAQLQGANANDLAALGLTKQQYEQYIAELNKGEMDLRDMQTRSAVAGVGHFISDSGSAMTGSGMGSMG